MGRPTACGCVHDETTQHDCSFGSGSTRAASNKPFAARSQPVRDPLVERSWRKRPVRDPFANAGAHAAGGLTAKKSRQAWGDSCSSDLARHASRDSSRDKFPPVMIDRDERDSPMSVLVSRRSRGLASASPSRPPRTSIRVRWRHLVSVARRGAVATMEARRAVAALCAPMARNGWTTAHVHEPLWTKWR